MNQIAVIGIICALFSFVDAQGLTITTPNGSEEFIIGNKHPIHWNWSGSISSVKLEYSLDGCINWILIASSTQNDGDYLWTIPDTTSSNCFIRISDVANSMINDLCDGSFSILRQSIDIRKPDGGEILVIGETCPIHWDWTGKFNDVKIEYSTDAGGTWVSITNSTSNDGSYNWTIPNTPSPTCLIRVTNKDDIDCSNTSDAFFSIALNTISIIQPDGGEAYTIGENYPIYWDWTGSFNDVKIQYSTDAGGTWISITNSTSNDGSYNWIVSNTPSNNCRVKITNTTDPNCLDSSAANFTILATSLQLIAPNGGENYRVGDICPIHWNWSGTIGSVKLEYSIDGGITWYSITNSTGNDGDYDWTIPNIPTTQCRTKITNLADPNCWDVSNTNFTVQRPAFSIFDPDNGKELVAGEIYPIHWNWLGTVSSVKLELWYKTESGVEWWTVTSNTANDGSHDITMPYFISDSCGIKLTSNDDLSCFTLSEVFKITRPTITIVYPFSGTHLIEGEDFEIIWNWNGSFSSVMLQYSNDLGANWQTMTTNTSNDGSYAWEVPTGVWSSYLLKVINTADIDCYDVSDIFNVDKDTISVMRPAASDTFFIRRKHPIYWRTVDDFHSVRINYLTDAWRTITLATDNMGYYIWTCDTFKSSNARIAVTSNLNTGTSGLSGSFIIADTTSLISDSLRILAPISGDTFAIGGKCCITWHSVNFAPPNNVTLSYSIDNGPWVTIATVSNNDKSYLWTLPNYVTNNCRISVSDVNGVSVI